MPYCLERFLVFLPFILILTLMIVVSLLAWLSQSKIHYANKPHTHCGIFIHGPIQHTTIAESVTCPTCRRRISHPQT